MSKDYFPLQVIEVPKEFEDMPQVTYGVVDDGEHREGAGQESTAQTPLLANEGAGSSPGVFRKPADGSASITSGVGNLANTILGTGVLAFPLVSVHSC